MLKNEKNMSPKWAKKLQGIKTCMQLKGVADSVILLLPG
jgi:hypothetical protein